MALRERLSGNTFYLMQYMPDLCARVVMGVMCEQVAKEIIKHPEVPESFRCHRYHALSCPDNVFLLYRASSIHAGPAQLIYGCALNLSEGRGF